MVLSAACDIFGEDVQDGNVFNYPNAVTLEIGTRGSVPSDVVTVPHQVYCEGTNRTISKVSKKDSGAPGSEPDKTDWQQQQQQQQQGTTATLNHVNGLRFIGVNSRLPGAFGTAGDKGRLPFCQGKMETSAKNLWEILANSGSVICETECKIISGLAAEEYLIDEQHFLNDNAELGKQVRNGVWAISSPEQNGAGQIGEPEDHSGYGSPVAREHGISIAPKETDPGTTWLIASAAPHHATGNRALLSGFALDQGDLFVKAGDAGAAPMRVVGRGNVVTDAVVLPNVWYVPGLTVNVVSVSQLAELDYSVAFGHGRCNVKSSEDGVVVGTARAGEDGLFALDFIKVPLGI
ncbi:hypothetical protein C2845_PM18G07060 [Panicum miliaceum]|uniref:Retrovirus-related Pol polyprotein from transposon TNT 1-94-like beta-barrel domain-containing protein n=1 Tax=Panicum miliaceum TaxID=4540 RepID=A0A3L6PJI7_PANMI|nr:hypothetical protein C2845_PM18G07060 [Panicum miliaceum]